MKWQMDYVETGSGEVNCNTWAVVCERERMVVVQVLMRCVVAAATESIL